MENVAPLVSLGNGGWDTVLDPARDQEFYPLDKWWGVRGERKGRERGRRGKREKEWEKGREKGM